MLWRPRRRGVRARIHCPRGHSVRVLLWNRASVCQLSIQHYTSRSKSCSFRCAFEFITDSLSPDSSLPPNIQHGKAEQAVPHPPPPYHRPQLARYILSASRSFESRQKPRKKKKDGSPTTTKVTSPRSPKPTQACKWARRSVAVGWSTRLPVCHHY